MSALTRTEVESWPALGPMTLDKQRVLDLIARAEKAKLDYRGIVEHFDLDSLNKAHETMRERAEVAEAQLASITGVARLELVAAERAKQAELLAALVESRRRVTILNTTMQGTDEASLSAWIDLLEAAIAKAVTP